jgi:hypothetical protein
MAELLGAQVQLARRCWLVKVDGRLLIRFLQAFCSQVVVHVESPSRVRHYISESKAFFAHMTAKGAVESL